MGVVERADGMAQGVDGAEALLERRGAHRRRAHHVAARVDVVGVGRDPGQLLDHQPHAFHRDAVGHRVIAGAQ